MRILIINPNSDPNMTASIAKTAQAFAGGEYEVTCLPTPGAPVFIETYADAAQAAPGMMELVRKNEAAFDGFVVACHSDPNLDVLKEITKKPVVGIGETSMKMASLLGHRFSILTDNAHSIPGKYDQARKYYLEQSLASVRAPAQPKKTESREDIYAEIALRAVEEDGAEVLVLGCAGLTGLDKSLETRTSAPVLDGIICALIIVSGLVKYNVSTSKIRQYNPEA